MNNHKLISIDLAKNVFQVCILDDHNNIISNKKVTRKKLIETVMQSTAKRIVMESCYSSNYWGREFIKLGYQVDLIPPRIVKPFVNGNKTDHNDAIAIGEASMRPKVKFVPVKTIEQQDGQCLFKIRDRLIKQRTALTNQIRGLMSEYGIIFATTVIKLRNKIPYILEDADNELTVVSQIFLNELYEDLIYFDKRIKSIEKQSRGLMKNNDEYNRLLSIPGIGEVTASLLLTVISHPDHFKSARQFSAYLGLTPKQHSSGDTVKMLGISKRGNSTLRKNLILGAKAVIRYCANKTDRISLWLKSLLEKKPHNKVAVALANKIARTAWSLLKNKTEFNASNIVTN